MKKCPECSKWTLDFDDYFGRFRCFNPECGWIQTSAVERARRLLDRDRRPQVLNRIALKDEGTEAVLLYDEDSDTLVVDFGPNAPCFELPDPEGRMFWRVARHGDGVIGLVILGARKWGIKDVAPGLAAKKDTIEGFLRQWLAGGFPTRITRAIVARLEMGVQQCRERTERRTDADEVMQRLLESFQQQAMP